MSRPSATDIALALALAAWAVVEAAVLDGPGSRPERVVWALAVTLPLAWRRRAPAGVALGIAAVVAARVLIADQGTADEEGAMPFPAMLVASFTAAAHARTLALAAVAGLAVYGALLSAVVLSYYEGGAEPADGAILSFFAAGAWAAGYFVRRRAAGGEAQAREAVVEERSRISRELHDIIGHSMSIVSLQAGAAEQLLRRDPDRAEEHVRAVRRTAAEALGEMRRLMGVLREDHAHTSRSRGWTGSTTSSRAPATPASTSRWCGRASRPRWRPASTSPPTGSCRSR